MTASDLQPISIVEDKGFVQYSEALDRKYQLPARKTLCNVLLPKQFDELQEEIQQKLSNVPVLSRTTDLWNSNTNAGFMMVTGDFWNSTEEVLESNVLDCHRVFGRHTADMI